MQRQFIRDGDTTTTGGTVHASGSQDLLDGRNTCWEGDPVYCPACKSTGVTKCVQPYRPYTRDGKQINLDGDLCICKCPKPPRLKSKFNNSAMSFDGGAIAGNVAAAGWLRYAGHATTPQYDEKVQFATDAETMSGLPVFIELHDGRTVSGYLGNDGSLPRIETEGENFYHVYWGDAALARMEGAEA